MYVEKNYITIVTELSTTNLFKYINWTYDKQTEDNIKHIFVSIVSAVKYLHDNDLMHCDIKPENILVKLDASLNLCYVKVADLGYATYCTSG